MKKMSRGGRVFSICVWASILSLGVLELRSGKLVPLALLQVAAGLMLIVREATVLLSTPNE